MTYLDSEIPQRGHEAWRPSRRHAPKAAPARMTCTLRYPQRLLTSPLPV